jgi:WS/DGAT/MGAT family acyltransferase
MSTPPALHQLASGDAVFLSTETATAWGHIGGLSILDPSTTTGFGFEKLVRSVEARIPLVPRFTWRLREVPLGLDEPYWVESERFDVRHHVRRIAVPAPGGMQQLGELAGHLFSRPMDRSRPLWEIWLIEGLEGGRFAMFMKTHHSLMDGQAGVGLAEVMTDLSADATQPPLVPDVMNEAPPKAPGLLDLAWNAARNTAGRQVKRAGHVATAFDSFVWKPLTRGADAPAQPAWSEVPKVSFNAGVSERRYFACTSLDLEALKEIKKHFDVTLNDVVLEVIGGALRRWLRAKGELPEQPLIALCPVSLRDTGDQRLNNQVTTMAVSMATHLADPAERLRAIAGSSRRSKESMGGSFDVLAALAESFAPGVVSAVTNAAALAAESIPLPGNLVVSNVRGTPVPLYMAGARVDAMFPMSVLQSGQGLNATVVSYMGTMQFGFTVDPDLVPDADDLTEQVQRAFEELQSAAEGVVHRAR